MPVIFRVGHRRLTRRILNLSWVLANTSLDAIVADVLEPAERQRVADEARAIFERLGAQPYLAQLVAALAPTHRRPMFDHGVGRRRPRTRSDPPEVSPAMPAWRP